MTSPSSGAREQLRSLVSTLRWPALPAVNGVARDASVLVLFGVLDGVLADTHDAAVARDLDVLLQRRASTLSSHPGQVSFPGGRAEPGDADAVATALREANEEVGLTASGVDVLGALPTIPLFVSNNRVTPVLGWWERPTQVAAVDHAETVDVFRIPVADLLDPANRVMAVHDRRDARYRGPAFIVDDVLVWGFTAFILDTVFEHARWTLPWDQDREHPV
ncbi:NUDIX hydrolase [Microbacterium sp. No. 7]|uniref:NUDIX hydrolase n=1 Tax=Microbacterium sp. No. 7 TaxID=1714373 RepID=UPI0006CF6B41|nr:NUDIX hydrolase [Microbacterium sp. No. 7]